MKGFSRDSFAKIVRGVFVAIISAGVLYEFAPGFSGVWMGVGIAGGIVLLVAFVMDVAFEAHKQPAATLSEESEHVGAIRETLSRRDLESPFREVVEIILKHQQRETRKQQRELIQVIAALTADPKVGRRETLKELVESDQEEGVSGEADVLIRLLRSREGERKRQMDSLVDEIQEGH